MQYKTQWALSAAETNGTELPFDSRTKFTYFTYSVSKGIIYINQISYVWGIPPSLIWNIPMYIVGLVADNSILNELIVLKQKGAFPTYLTLRVS